MDYSDLKNKTIFDFTDDPDVINLITFEIDREKYLSNTTIGRRYFDFDTLADLIHNSVLEREAANLLASLCNFTLGYSDLKNKTIFDFTDDPDVIESIIGNEPREEHIARLTPRFRYYDLAELAEITNNQELADAAEEQLAPLCRVRTGLE